MKIDNIKRFTTCQNNYLNLNLNLKKDKPVTNQNQSAFCGLGALSLFVKNEQFREFKFSDKFLTKNGKVSKESCEDIIQNHPQTLLKAYKTVDSEACMIDQTPQLCAKAGYNLKKYFDEHFKDYRIVSIGTSPASIAQAMEYLGSEVIYLPASGVKDFGEENHTSFLKRPKAHEIRNAKIISEYFRSKLPKNDNKTNILIDFTISGKSMKTVSEILSKNTGISKDKFKCFSLIKTLNSCKDKNVGNENESLKLTDKEIEDIRSDCMAQTIEYVSNVPHFHLIERYNQNLFNDELKNKYISSTGKSLPRIFAEFEKYSSRLARAYSLCTYNELKKMELV